MAPNGLMARKRNRLWSLTLVKKLISCRKRLGCGRCVIYDRVTVAKVEQGIQDAPAGGVRSHPTKSPALQGGLRPRRVAAHYGPVELIAPLIDYPRSGPGYLGGPRSGYNLRLLGSVTAYQGGDAKIPPAGRETGDRHFSAHTIRCWGR